MSKRETRKKNDYNKLKRAAYQLIVVEGKTQRQAAEILGVSEQSMSDWAKDGDWRNMRKARQSAESTTIENIRQIIAIASSKRLQLEDEINEAVKTGDKEKELELRRKANSYSDEISKQNATLKNMDKVNGITLGVYIDVMDDIFNCLREHDEDLFEKTIDFQTLHARRKINELG